MERNQNAIVVKDKMKPILKLSLLAVFILSLGNCAVIDKIRGKPKKKPVPVSQTPESTETDSGSEFDEFNASSTPQSSQLAATPASPMLKNGIESFKSDDFESAEWQFEEAINLDPNYGPSYYWLARVKYKFNQKNEALELLKKADKLVPGSPLWQGRIRKFREFLINS